MPVTEHRYARRVQFAETDMAGMAHFSCFLRYVEEAEHALWREAGLRIADQASPYGFPRVAFSIDYLAPLRFEDEIEVWIRIAAMSVRSIQYRSEILRDGVVVARSTHTAVCIRRDVEPIVSAELPAAVRAALAAG